METNPFIGIVYHWIGGFASATNFIPFRGIKRWSWEIYWLVQGIAAWLIAPYLFATLLIPDLHAVLAQAPDSSLHYAILWGMLWGVGGLTFGLSVRYLGIALGYAIALGLSTAFGTLIPPIYSGQIHVILHERSGQVILGGVAMCLIAVAVNGMAGWSKENEITATEKAEAGERDFSLLKGLAVAVFAGIMSSFFAFGLTAGAPIGEIARRQLEANGRMQLFQNLPVLVVVLWGGFATNVVWSIFLILRNKSMRQFAGAAGDNPMGGFAATTGNTARLEPKTLFANYAFAALAGVVWYFQFFFYSMGQTKMGKYDFSSWTLHMASIIIFATLWGIFLKEWRGTSLRTRVLVGTGLALLIGSTLVVGYGNYLKVNEGAPQVQSAH